MVKRNLMILLGSICILVVVAGVIASNWSADISPTQTEDNTTDGNTTDDEVDNTSDSSNNTDNSSSSATSNFSSTTVDEALADNKGDHDDDSDYTWDGSDVVTIALNGDSISVNVENVVTVDGSTVTITSAGTYSLSGTLDDGQIIVDTDDTEDVRLILDGVTISSATNAPIYVEKADTTIIVLADDTENYLTDTTNNEDNATLLSKDDLTICGDGTLTVIGNTNDAIRSNDGLVIENGTIIVTSGDDGIRGKDYLVIKDGKITVNAVGDALKSDNDEEEDKGYISIKDGTITVTSTQGDAITAQTDLLITDGTFMITSGGGSSVALNEDVSTKGLKAGVSIIIDGGDFTVSSSDDAINSNGVIVINSGTFEVSSGDEGINADISLEINGGTIEITKSVDGMKSAVITINNGIIQITSSDDGVSSNNHLLIKDGDITVNSVGDGLKADNDDDVTKGYITIEDGTITVIATKGDAITAQTNLLITDGTFTLTSGGGSSARLDESVSTKGLKAGVSITIDGGDFTISSSDDAIHSNDVIVINDGTFDISSGDDGIHADTSVEINGGTFGVSKSYEGLESATVTINNGIIQITSSDDGINLAGGNDGSAIGGRPGQGGFANTGNYSLYINGGVIAIDSGGDGIDANGFIEMTDGVLIINGPTSNMNGALDFVSFEITGGTVVAAGSVGMAQAPSSSAIQYSVNLRFGSVQSANVLVNIQTESGETVLTFMPTKMYQSLVFSSPELATGTYYVYVGGSCTGTSTNGLYEDGTYSDGTEVGSFTIS